jgi:glycosyltransferase involved in cell wall biosynthesis
MVWQEPYALMKILLISSDAISLQMAGPGIRYWEFARHLAQRHAVTLLTPNQSSLAAEGFQMRQRTRQTLAAALAAADVIVTQGYIYPLIPLYRTTKPLVVDLYDPLPIELLEHHAHLPLMAAQLSHSYCVRRTQMLLWRGDYFLYSHAAQRDYWLGLLTATGRVNHQQYRCDPNFTTLFGCVPYGIADEPPIQTQSPLRTDAARFAPNDKILCWGGGLWKWFDPCSVIRALGEIARVRQDIKLFFLATRRAASDSTGINIAYATDEAVALSQELGLYNRLVFFNDTWVPYAERQNYLVDATIGLSTHFETLETHFSIRTRLLDYLWAGLPIITTRGDYLSDLVAREALGLVVAPQNVPEIQAAIVRLCDDQALHARCQQNIRQIRQQFRWSRILAPLEAFCEQPYRTSTPTAFARGLKLAQFYMQVGRELIRYQGYQKILTKLRRAFSIKK